MRLHQALKQATEVVGDDTYCVTRPKYFERNCFVEVRDDGQTLMLHSWALPTPGTTFCPTFDDLKAHDWDVFFPQNYS